MVRRRWLGVLGSLPPFLWLVGLVIFATDIPSDGPPDLRHTDAIVVLTGGSERLETGLALLRQGLAEKLFVSGVYRGVDVAALLKLSRLKPDPLECCIVLGYSADSTSGNAIETAQWMRAQNYRSLRLVTANYHMRRSLMEFHHALPEAEIIAHAVFPDAVKRREWWLWPGTLHLIISEYSKYLLGLLRHSLALGAPTYEEIL